MIHTHLHVHSHYTFLGATPSVQDLAQRAAADGFSHLALTDTNGLHGAVAFARACRDVNIQPITGMVVTVAPSSSELAAMGTGLLTLLAMNREGYISLCRLSAQLQARPDREAAMRRGLDWSQLCEENRGLLCLSGGRRGWIQRALGRGDRERAAQFARQLVETFGDRAYLSLESHPRAGDADLSALMALAQEVGLPLAAVQPVYCLERGERDRLRLLAAMQATCTLDQIPTHFLPDEGENRLDLHWLPAAEMAQRFAVYPEALARTVEIAARCGPALPDGRSIWPVLDLPPDCTPEAELAAQAEQGLWARYGATTPADSLPGIQTRLQRELAAIAHHGYAPLFLMVADVVRFARSQEIPVSTRGSVANSLVAFCLDITTVDPIAHDLLFERFLNPARQEPPDIDLDFCSRRRDEVLAYVRQKYGEDRVALVATISTLQPKSALRETAKAYGLSEEEAGKLAQQVHRGWHPDPRRRGGSGLTELLDGLTDPRQRRVVQAAAELVGQPHHLSIHPGGVVVTPGPLTDVTPVQWTPKGFLATQYDHGDVEAVGLVKMDLLGIRALTVLADAAHLVQRRRDPDFRLNAIPLQDPATSALLTQAETVGVFQCESTGAQRTLRQLRAGSVRDLAVANAFFKPGPATGGMAAAFVRRYRGEETVRYLHPALEPILAPTKGVLLFQEQILRVATEIAGLDWTAANHLRRGMSKFQPEEMTALRQRFVTGCQDRPDRPFTSGQAETLWRQVEAFAGYGFNQGHATAYADVSYRSAYLKAHFPAEFLCARLADWGGFHHQAIYIAEARRLGIAVRPPHVNHSRRHFSLGLTSEDPVLYMGLGQVRDLRQTTIQALIRQRPRGGYQNVAELLGRVDLRSKEITHLIQCGGLDGLGPSRAAMLVEAEEIQRAGSAAQLTFGFAPEPALAENPTQRIAWERHLLGQPVSVHPLMLTGAPLSESALSELLASPGKLGEILGIRLPGWTGGKGYFLDVGHTYVLAISPDGQPRPAVWEPVRLRARWQVDEWGGGWLGVVERPEKIPG